MQATDRQRYSERLQTAALDLNLKIRDQQIEALLDYVGELNKWNRAYNLTAIKQESEMVDRHIIDSLSISSYLEDFIAKKTTDLAIIDIGTGAGIPGIILAILFPQVQFTLLDSNGKKTRFLFQLCITLGLKNVKVENNRVEKFSPAAKFDIVTSRAFASLQDMVNGSRQLLKGDGCFWAMKGQYPADEIEACDARLVNSHKLVVPHCEGERHLIILE